MTKKKSVVDEILSREMWEELAPKTPEEALERATRRKLSGLSDAGFTILANAVNWEAKRRLRKLRKGKKQ